MSQEERDDLYWLKQAKNKVISQVEAGKRMGVSDRWVRKQLKRMEKVGDEVVVHGLRGRRSNHKIDAKTRAKSMEALKQPDWHDFGPTFASEQLAKQYEISVSDETLRKWMIEDGIWKSRVRKAGEVHCWRPRRSGFGELVQWDTSEHDWLEGRGPVRYLVRLIDDASSVSWGRFVERDATPYNMAVFWEYVEKYGRMVDTYTDKDSMFAIARRAGESKQDRVASDKQTQIGRALRELEIGLILAHSPQAKGRVERSHLTAQDRLVKQLRLAKISTMKDANGFLEEEYWPEWNERFALPLEGMADHHRPLGQLELAAILCHVEDRVIDNGFTFAFNGRRYQIVPDQAHAGMRRNRLRLELRLDGELKACYQGKYVDIRDCLAKEPTSPPADRKQPQKDHNAGGKSQWMQGFFERTSPPLWKLLDDGK